MNDVISPIRDRSHERARLRIYSDMLNGDERDYELMLRLTQFKANEDLFGKPNGLPVASLLMPEYF